MLHLNRPYIILALAAAVALWPLFFSRFYGVGDIRSIYIPLENFFAEQQRHFQLPAWMPDAAWGFPAIASAQIGFFYPPLLLTRFLPIFIYLPILLWLHIFALGLGAYYFARLSGISKTGSLISALAVSLNAFVWQHLTHLNITFALAWFPWQLIIAHRLAKSDRPPLKQFALLSFALGVPFLAGQLQAPFLIALFTTAYYLSLIPKRPFPSRRVILFALTGFIAAALTAVQTLPTLELAAFSSRGSAGTFSLERANQHSFPIYHLPTLLFPRFFGSDDTYWGKRIEVEYGFFFGVIPLLLSLIAARLQPRRHRFWIIAGGITFLLSLGELSPFRLLGFEPSLWYFSAPARWLFFTVFSGSILAGFGYDLLPNIPPRCIRALKLTGYFILAAIIIYNLTLWMLPDNFAGSLTAWLQSRHLTGARDTTYYLNKINSLLVSARQTGLSLISPYTYITLIPLLAAPWLLTRRRWFVPLTIFELVVIAGTANPSVPWSNILNPPDSISALPDSVTQNHARVISITAPGDTGLWLTNPETRADSARREQYRAQLEPLTHSLFNIAGSQWPASLDLQSHANALEDLLESREDQLYLDPAKASELNIGAALIANEAPHTVPNLKPNQIEPNISLYTFPAKPRAALIFPDGKETALDYDSSETDSHTFSFRSSQPTTLVIRNTWYPGWQASLDNQPVSIEKYNGIFQSLPVPSGQHTITFTYQPRFLNLGLIISSCTAILLSLFVVIRFTVYTPKHTARLSPTP